MKIIIMLLTLFTVLACNQDNATGPERSVEKEVTYWEYEIGAAAFSGFQNSMINTTLKDYQYILYSIDAPFTHVPDKTSWDTMVHTRHYDDGAVLIGLFYDQTIEYLFASNVKTRANNGQALIKTTNGKGNKSSFRMGQIKRLIKREQAKALKKIPKEISALYVNGYPFLVKEENLDWAF